MNVKDTPIPAGMTNWEAAGLLVFIANMTGFAFGMFNGTPMVAFRGVRREEIVENWATVREEQQRERGVK